MCPLISCHIFVQLFCSDSLLVWLWCQWLFRVWRDETSVSCLSPMTCFPSQASHDDSEEDNDDDEYHDNMMRMMMIIMRMSMRIMMGTTCCFPSPHVAAQDRRLSFVKAWEKLKLQNQQSIMYCSAIVVCGTVCSKRTGELGPGNSQRVTRSTTMKMTTTIGRQPPLHSMVPLHRY